PPHIVPEWYFLPFYAILRAIPDKLGGVAAMGMAIVILYVLPWLDTSKVRVATYRPIYKQLFWIFVVNIILLGWLGQKPAEGTYLIMSRLSTAYYFIFFLILPLVGKFEKTKQLPVSIFEEVAKKHRAKEDK
ncbi:MAG: cytochrome b, partial [Rhodospirillaceae bacterium]|nr:cytochrome b [Rhodospirillaceae bacterium]